MDFPPATRYTIIVLSSTIIGIEYTLTFAIELICNGILPSKSPSVSRSRKIEIVIIFQKMLTQAFELLIALALQLLHLD